MKKTHIQIRVSEEMKSEWERLSLAAGLSLSSWIIQRCCGEEVVVDQEPEELTSPSKTNVVHEIHEAVVSPVPKRVPYEAPFKATPAASLLSKTRVPSREKWCQKCLNLGRWNPRCIECGSRHDAGLEEK